MVQVGALEILPDPLQPLQYEEVCVLIEERGEISVSRKDRPGGHRACPPGPLGKDRELPAAASLAATAPVVAAAAVAIGALLLRPGFIHDQGPSGKLRTVQSFDGLLRLS